MIELNGSAVIGKCNFCNELITNGVKHHLINRGLKVYYICPRCYNDIIEVKGDKDNDK